MAPSATTTQALPSKMKRPGVQTNGLNSSTSSPSPSMSASRLPSAAKYPPNTSASNGFGNTNGSRSASRVRRDAPPQLLGRGQRNSSVGLRSASILGESAVAQMSEPQPYVKSDEYILKKYRGNPPSLVVHLHPTHFRFDQQEGSFTYKSPMKMVLEHFRQRTVPHDLIEFMPDVPIYEGCMIVQIYDHKSSAPSPGVTKAATDTSKALLPFSVHNYNAYLTPSSYVPYPLQNSNTGKRKVEETEDTKPKTTEQKDKENMPAPGLPTDGQRGKAASLPKKPKITTIVLHPTPLSNHVDLANKAAEGRVNTDAPRDGRQDGPLSATVPPTPTTGIPSTPSTNMAPPAKRVKKAKAELDSSNIYAAESHITIATTAPLILDPVSSVAENARLLQTLAHPMHSERPPAPKTRKRTVAEMEADEALAAEQERYMLILDERLSSNIAGAQGSANPTGGDGQAGGVSFEPRFERFKVIENIKAAQEETKKAEKLRREEADRKQRQDQERNKLRDEAEKREQDKVRTQTMQQAAAARAQQENARRQMAAQAQQNHQGTPTQAQAPHAHPQASAANNMATQPQRFHQQQVSQAQTSSPIARNGTPQSHSSPTVNNMGNVPMQHSTSSMGGSPPRPGSVVHQNHTQMGAPTGHVMTTQRSQQSHAGTPRLPNSTPNVVSTPLNRQMSQTPRMSQGSPMQGPMAPTAQMPMMNGQQMQMTPQQQQMLQQQRLQQMMRNQQIQQQQQAQAQGMVGMTPGGHQMSPQQMAQAQQLFRQQQQVAQQQGMVGGGQNYAAAAMAMAAQQRNAGLPPNMNQNFMNGGGVPNMQQMSMQQMQQIQQMQMRQAQAHAAQVAQQAQQQHHPEQQSMNPQQQVFHQQVMQIASQLYNTQRLAMAPNYPGGNIPPEVDRQLKARCQQNATAQLSQSMRRRQQQMMAAQGGMQQNMMSGMSGMNGINGMNGMNGGGM